MVINQESTIQLHEQSNFVSQEQLEEGQPGEEAKAIDALPEKLIPQEDDEPAKKSEKENKPGSAKPAEGEEEVSGPAIEVESPEQSRRDPNASPSVGQSLNQSTLQMLGKNFS